jgi:predicted RNA-binding protein with RPS1 domain
MLQPLNITHFYTDGMSASAKIILIDHLNDINLLIRKYNENPNEETLNDIKGLIPQTFKAIHSKKMIDK